MVWNIVENYIVTLPTFGTILFRVINHVICAERSDKIDILSAAYTGHLRACRFGDLHGKRADTSRRTVDQDLLPGLNVSFITKRLQRRDARDVDRSRLLKCDVCRLDRDGSIRAWTNVLGKGTSSSAEDIIAWFELGDVFAHGFNRAGKIDAQSCVLWLP